jgi:hypothetical protein
MMFLNYDLAKALQDDRLARAQARSLRRRARPEPRLSSQADPVDEAEVIELVFGRHCDAGQIGA